MKTNRLAAIACGLAAGGVLLASHAGAADKAGPDAALKAYRQDRAACLAGFTTQDRTSCLREAGAALSEARQGRFADDPSQFEKNRLARCDLQPPADRPDCLRRMSGEGIVRGSVEEGGIYRELTRTIDPAKER